MRRVLLVVGVLCLGALAFALWPSPEQVPPPVEAPPSAPSFERVDVLAGPSQQALTLTGTVRDPSGQPIAGAEVSLAAATQRTVTGLRCGLCSEWLLSCHAHESARTVATMFEQRSGELAAALTTRSDAQGKFRFEGLAGTSFTVWGRAQGFGEGIKERAAPGDPVELFLPAPRVLAGRLRDEVGRPVVGTVRLMSRRLAHVIELTTDAQGAFEAGGLGEGPFAVSATAPNLLPALDDEVEAGAEPVVLTLEAPRRLEVRVIADGKPKDAVVALQGDHLSRQLAAKAGFVAIDALYPGELVVSAVAGALSSAPQHVTLAGPITQVTLTLEQGGTLAVTVLDEADQPVTAPKLELLTRGGELINERRLQTGELAVLGPVGPGDYQLRATAEGYQPAMVPAKVKPGETAVELTMTRGTVISGRVIDEYGRPAPQVSVLITPTGDSVLADTEGRFSAAVPSPGLYELHAHHSDWGGGDLAVQAPKEGVELQLEPKAGAEITVSANGRRVEGASATLFHAKGNFRSDRTSGADGVVLMRGLPPGEYMLVATHPEFLQSDRQPLTLRDGELQKLSAELKAGAKIDGQVVDTVGAPVAQVSVTVVPRGAEPAVTDGEGRFTLSPLRPGGLYTLRVTQKGFDQLERTTARAGGEPVRVVVRRQRVFRGRVLGAGQPLKSFRVDEHEVTSADGRFELPLPATEDKVIVSVEAPGFEPLMADRPNTPELGDFDLVRAPLVTGVVRDEGGAPVVDAVVSCDTCEQSVLSGQDGRFSLGKPAFQREFTVVAKKGRRTATRTVTERAMQGLELVLKQGVKLSGVAYLPGGAPAAGLEIAGVHVERSEPVSVVTNADGSYAMEVAPGTYRFMLTAPGVQLSEDPPALIVDVQGSEARVDFGPVPGLATLLVRVAPKPGFALWLLKGDVRAVGNPPLELLRASWAQLVYQPRAERLTLGGLSPGRYTLVWASFHAAVPPGPVIVPVTVPASGEVQLVQ